jgi:hypothetical protein
MPTSRQEGSKKHQRTRTNTSLKPVALAFADKGSLFKLPEPAS